MGAYASDPRQETVALRSRSARAYSIHQRCKWKSLRIRRGEKRKLGCTCQSGSIGGSKSKDCRDRPLAIPKLPTNFLIHGFWQEFAKLSMRELSSPRRTMQRVNICVVSFSVGGSSVYL